MVGGTGVCYNAHVAVRTTFGSVFSPSTLWVLGMELRSPDLAANTVTC